MVPGGVRKVAAVYYLSWQRKVIGIEPAITVVDCHVNIDGRAECSGRELETRGIRAGACLSVERERCVHLTALS